MHVSFHRGASILATVALIASITGFVLFWGWLAFLGMVLLIVTLLVIGMRWALRRQRYIDAYVSSNTSAAERERHASDVRAGLALDIDNNPRP